jgi:hypothetical protein
LLYSSFLLREHWVIDSSAIGLHFLKNLLFTVRLLSPALWLNRKPRLQLSGQIGRRHDARMLEDWSRLQTQDWLVWYPSLVMKVLANPIVGLK